MNVLKLTAGLGAVDDYNDFVDAGADELFAGYVPSEWQLKYGSSQPMNRREVCYCNVQLGARSELLLLREQISRRGVPVTLTLNSLSYMPEAYPTLAEYMLDCRSCGFDRFIIADPALLVYLNEQSLSGFFHIHISGETGELNRYMIKELSRLGAERIIFHRKVSIPDMQAIVSSKRENMAYEAFLLNEMCHFHGGYCNSLHADELPPICREPYRLRRDNVPECQYGSTGTQNAYDGLGAGGCGLCALWKLRKVGVAYLKIVGRGAHTVDIRRDISAAKLAVSLLEESDSEKIYQECLMKELFPEGCSGNCYYREI